MKPAVLAAIDAVVCYALRLHAHILHSQDWNETLFYRLLIDNFEEMNSVVYTPTVGWCCINYSRMFRSARGMYFTSR